MRIERVLETHTHADHVSGHGRFALEHGLPVAIHAARGGRVPVRAARRRPDRARRARPRSACCTRRATGRSTARSSSTSELVLTGDSLFVGDAARPDLAVAAREGAQDLFRSLDRLAALGDDVEVYPGHVAGSLCGGNMSERALVDDRQRAARRTTRSPTATCRSSCSSRASVSTPRPPTTERVVALNRGPWLGAAARA